MSTVASASPLVPPWATTTRSDACGSTNRSGLNARSQWWGANSRRATAGGATWN